MANTTSAKKALRQSHRKRLHNLLWKSRIKDVSKNIKRYLNEKNTDIDILKKEEALLYKVVDKAAKNKVIHKNKAGRIKSRVSKQIAAHEKTGQTKKPNTEKATATRSKSKS